MDGVSPRSNRTAVAGNLDEQAISYSRLLQSAAGGLMVPTTNRWQVIAI